jgi:outer membrane protein insertion porin family
LRDVIASEEAKFWKFLSKNTSLNSSNIELDKRLLVNYYKSLGYYDVQVLSNNAVVTEKSSTVLTYTINAGTRYRITKISTNVSEVLDKKLFLPMQDSYLKIIGKYHSPFRIKKLLDTLDLLIVANDLQFIEHSVSEVIEGETIEVKINVYEGSKQLVEKIIIVGNAVTDESVIRGELLLDEGDPFNKLKLDQSIAKIKSRKLFGSVEKTVIEGSSINEKIVKITVEETPTGEISAGAGIGTNGGSFAFNISENNWLGRGINVTTSIDVSAETFSGGLNVTDPNYNFSGNSINYFIKNSTNDKEGSGFKNNIISTGIGTSFEQYRNLYLSPSIVYSYDDLKVNSSGSKSLQKQKGTFSDLTFGYGITFDERDRTYAPTDGYISRFNQSIPIYADSPFLKNTYTLSKYKTLSPDTIAAVKFYTSAINGLDDKDVRLSKRITLPSNKLRGFKQLGPKDGNDYVGGNYAASTNLELSLPNLLPESTKTDIGLFLDIGNVWGIDYDKSLDDSKKIRSSTGISTNWISPLGPMSFIFSKNITKANTDSTESFNFRLGTSF